MTTVENCLISGEGKRTSARVIRQLNRVQK
jgi:hypothetical protein